MKKTVLITGIAGLLGSRLVDWILDNHPEYDVIGVDNLQGGYLSNVDKRVKYVSMIDLASDEPVALRALFNIYEPEYVFHFAAYAAEGLSPFMRMFNYQNNMVSTAHVVNECIRYGVKRLVYTSSMSVYGHGKGDGTIFDEDDQPAPIDPYGVSKYACEQDIQIAGVQHDLDWCIIRPHNIYGEKQNIWDMYRNVLGIWMRRILNSEPMLIYGDGEQKRSFTYVEDNLPCLWRAAVDPKASKQIINLGGEKPYTLNVAADTLRKIVKEDGIEALIEHREPRHEVKFAVPTWQKSKDILGFVHKTDLEDGLRKMWMWAKEQPKRPLQRWGVYELPTGIYSYWK